METLKLTKKQMMRIIFALEHSLGTLQFFNEETHKEYVDLLNKIGKKVKSQKNHRHDTIKSYDNKPEALLRLLESELSKRRRDGKTRRQAATEVLRTIKGIKK